MVLEGLIEDTAHTLYCTYTIHAHLWQNIRCMCTFA